MIHLLARIQLHSPQSLWVVMALLAIALGTVVWLYRGQGRWTRSGVGWLLPLLRVTALSALAVSLFRPEILTPIEQEQRSAVAVLVDQSRSMSAVDSTRTPAQMVQLAAALGALPQGVRSSEMSDLRDGITDLSGVVDEVERARSEQQYAQLAGRGIEAAEAHLRDARRELRERVVELTTTAPEELARMVALIDSDDSAARIAQAVARIDQLQEQADLELYRSDAQVQQVCTALAGSSRSQLVGRALGAEAGLLDRIESQRPVYVFGLSESLSPLSPPYELEAGGTHGDLAAVARALQGGLEDQPLGAIVLFSDGRRIVGSARDLAFGVDVPVFAIAAAASEYRDLAIEQVWVPEALFTGQPIQVGVQVRAVGYDSPEVQVTIESAGHRVSERVTIREQTAVARLPFRIEAAGPQVLHVEVTGLPGEATLENNHVERMVRVASDRIRIALLGGRPTRDFEYFREALRSDPSMRSIERVVSAGERAISADEIMEQDVVVLADLPQEALDGRQWDALGRLVNQKGGSLIVATADPSIAAGYSTNPLAAGLLPWRGDAAPTARIWPGAEPVFRIVPAEDGADAFQLWDSSDPGSPRWSDLPPVYRFLALPPLRSGAQALLMERDLNAPVLARFRVGAGRVMFLGLDELWRWQAALVDSESERLWPRLVHQSGCRPFTVTDGAHALDVDALKAEPGQPVRVRARARDGATLEVHRGERLVLSRPLTAAAGRNDLETSLTDLEAGDYTLRLAPPAPSAGLSLPLRVREDFESEMRDVSADQAELRRLVGPRGEVLPLSEVHTLPRRLSRLKESNPAYAQTRLWDSPYLFLFVLACLGMEWALRKRVGLI